MGYRAPQRAVQVSGGSKWRTNASATQRDEFWNNVCCVETRGETSKPRGLESRSFSLKERVLGDKSHTCAVRSLQWAGVKGSRRAFPEDAAGCLMMEEMEKDANPVVWLRRGLPNNGLVTESRSEAGGSAAGCCGTKSVGVDRGRMYAFSTTV